MSFVSSLNETPYALTFAGQATPWRAALDEIARDPEIAEIVAGVIKASDQVLSPVRRSLATQSVASLPFELPAAPESAAVTRDVAGPDEAALSVPGIVAAQLGALIDLTRAGLNIVANQPTAFEGHSQGVLGVEIARAWIAGDEARAASVFALARLIGAAAARITRRARAPHAGDATYMVSVRGVSDALLGRIVESLPSTSHPLSIALRNDTDTHVVSGAPGDLASLVAAIERAAAKDKAAHDAHERGGRPLTPVCEYLPVYVPFHSPMLADALTLVDEWAAQCGIDAELAHSLAAAVLTTPVDWPAQIRAAAESGAAWIIDMGPGSTTVRMTRALVEGTGVGVVAAGTASDRDKAATPGWAPEPGSDWSHLRPGLVTLPDGKTVVDTA
ncbi:MAG: type I polyketide synthase, partial [Actinomyces sp.]